MPLPPDCIHLPVRTPGCGSRVYRVGQPLALGLAMQWVLSKPSLLPPSRPGVVPWLTCSSIRVSRLGSRSADRRTTTSSFRLLLHIMCCSDRCLLDPFLKSHFTDVITEAQSQGVAQLQLGFEPRSGFLVSSAPLHTAGVGLRGVRGVGGGGSLWGYTDLPGGSE